MHIQQQPLPKSQIELTITVPSQEYQAFLEKTAKKLADSSKFPGFRPGKVPYNIIKQRLGEGEIMKEAVLEIVNKTLTDAIKQENLLDFIAQPDLKIEKMVPGQDLVYKATLMLMPKVKMPNLDGISVKKKKIEIDPEEVEHALDHLAKSRAKEILKADQEPAQKNDLVDLDYELSLAGQPQADQNQKGFKVYLGDSHMVPGFEEQIVGLKKGDQKTFSITFPESYWQKDYAGKQAEFKVKVNSVYKVEKPKINDEFAKSLGDFKSAQDLKNKIQANIKLEKETEEAKRLENEMFDAIIKVTAFDDFPEKLINEEVERIFNEFKLMLKNKDAEMETWLKNMNKKEEEFKTELRPQADTRLKTNLIIHEVVKQEKIQPDLDKIATEVKKLSEVYQDNTSMLKRVQSDEYKDYLASGLVTQQAINWLKDKIVEE